VRTCLRDAELLDMTCFAFQLFCRGVAAVSGQLWAVVSGNTVASSRVAAPCDSLLCMSVLLQAPLCTAGKQEPADTHTTMTNLSAPGHCVAHARPADAASVLPGPSGCN